LSSVCHAATLLCISLRRPPTPPLLPYTTLFRSRRAVVPRRVAARAGGDKQRPRVARRRRAVGLADGGGAGAPAAADADRRRDARSEEHTSELQSLAYLVCRLLLEKKKTHDALVT